MNLSFFFVKVFYDAFELLHYHLIQLKQSYLRKLFNFRFDDDILSLYRRFHRNNSFMDHIRYFLNSVIHTFKNELEIISIKLEYRFTYIYIYIIFIANQMAHPVNINSLEGWMSKDQRHIRFMQIHKILGIVCLCLLHKPIHSYPTSAAQNYQYE